MNHEQQQRIDRTRALKCIRDMSPADRVVLHQLTRERVGNKGPGHRYTSNGTDVVDTIIDLGYLD